MDVHIINNNMNEEEFHQHYSIAIKSVLPTFQESEITSINYRTVLSDKRRFEDVLQRLAEKMEQYRADGHWNNLEGTILPFEPAALAIMVVMLKIWKRNNRITGFYRGGYDANKKALIGIAQELIDSVSYHLPKGAENLQTKRASC